MFYSNTMSKLELILKIGVHHHVDQRRNPMNSMLKHELNHKLVDYNDIRGANPIQSQNINKYVTISSLLCFENDDS